MFLREVLFMKYKTDIQIAQECAMEPITVIAARAHVPEEYLERALSAEDPTSPLPLTECFKDTIGEDYVHRAIPYLNDEGELQFVGFVRQIAGASYHEVLLPYAQTEEFSPYYEQILALAEEE